MRRFASSPLGAVALGAVALASAALVGAGGCSHVAPAPTANVPPPWTPPRPDAGDVPRTTTPTPTPPSRPPVRGGVQTLPGGAVLKPGTPPPVVPLTPPPSKDEPKERVDRTRPPPPGPTPPLDLPVPARRRLANGASVLVVERHALPLAAIVVVWPYGVGDEPPAQAGLAGLTADLLDEGAGGRGALELADALARLGVRLDTAASWDATTVSVLTTTRALDRLLPLLADVVARPSFAAPELERVKAERLAMLAQERDVPSVVASDTLSRLLYGERQRYGLPAMGTPATLARLGRADVIAWARARLRPDDATVIVVGDVTPDDIARRLDRALAGWTAAGRLPRHPPPPTGTARRRVVVVDRPGAAQTVVRVGLPGPPRKTRDFFPCLVANAILGGQFTSRLNMNLRERHGYTYGAGSDFAFRRDGGPFAAGAPVKTAVTGPALKETLGEIARLHDPVPADELTLAKELLARAMARAFETPPEVASTMVTQVVKALPDDYYKAYAAHIERVTAAEVRRAVARFIDPAQLAIVLVGDEAAIGAQVKAVVGDYERRDADGAPVPKS